MAPQPFTSPPIVAAYDSAGREGPPTGPIVYELRRLAALMEGCRVEPGRSCEDDSALAWVWQSLEDIEATITGLVRRQSP